MSPTNWLQLRRLVLLLAAATLPALDVSTASAEEALKTFAVASVSNPDPSLWAVQLIKEKGFDHRHGFNLQIKLKPTSVAYSEFINGTDPVCLCLTIATAARFKLQGVDVSLVSTYENYTAAYLVTENSGLQKPSDLPGHTLAGSTGSGSWVFQQYFLREHQGVDLAKVEIPSIVASSQAATLIAGRVDAISVFDDGRLKLEAAQPGRFRYIPTFDKDKWKAQTGVDYVPMFLLGARTEWVKQPENRKLLSQFEAAYKDAIDYLLANPAAVADDLGEKRTLASKAFLVDFLTQYPTAAEVISASDLRPAILALTQKILPGTGLIDRALSDQEVDDLIALPEPGNGG